MPHRRRWLRPLLGLLLLAMATPAGAAGQDGSFTTESWDAAIAVHRDGTVTVTDTITVDFPAPRRGIFLDLPAHGLLGTGGEGSGRTYAYHSITADPGPVAVAHGDTVTRIRVGDPQVTRTGRTTFEVAYTVTGAVHQGVAVVPIVALQWDGPVGEATVRLAEGGVTPEAMACSTGVVVEADAPDCRGAHFALGELDGLTVVMTLPERAVASATGQRPPVEDVDALLPGAGGTSASTWAWLFVGGVAVVTVGGIRAASRGGYRPTRPVPTGSRNERLRAQRRQGIADRDGQRRREHDTLWVGSHDSGVGSHESGVDVSSGGGFDSGGGSDSGGGGDW